MRYIKHIMSGEIYSLIEESQERNLITDETMITCRSLYGGWSEGEGKRDSLVFVFPESRLEELFEPFIFEPCPLCGGQVGLEEEETIVESKGEFQKRIYSYINCDNCDIDFRIGDLVIWRTSRKHSEEFVLERWGKLIKEMKEQSNETKSNRT